MRPSRSTVIIGLFFLGAIMLAWIIPTSWIAPEELPLLFQPSQDKSGVHIEDVSWGNGSPYITISTGNIANPVTLTGWSLEDAGGRRVEIGKGVEEVRLGKDMKESPIVIASGTAIIVTFSESPVGVSFHEDACSPYLRGTGEFTPQMERSCPAVDREPGYAGLDATCKSLLSSYPACQSVSPEHVGDVSASCRQFFATIPTYTHCKNLIGDAKIPRWRVYLPGGQRVLHADGGTISLIDSDGAVVDVLAYPTIGVDRSSH